MLPLPTSLQPSEVAVGNRPSEESRPCFQTYPIISMAYPHATSRVSLAARFLHFCPEGTAPHPNPGRTGGCAGKYAFRLLLVRFCTFCVSHCYGFSGTSRSSGVLPLSGCVPVQAPVEVMQLLPFVRELTSLKVEGFDPLVVFLCSTIEQLHNLRRLEVMSKVTPAEATQVLLRLCYTTHVKPTPLL